MHRVRPVIKNLSKRSSRYWQRLEEIVEERYKKFLSSKPVEKLTLEFKEDEELAKEESQSHHTRDDHESTTQRADD